MVTFSNHARSYLHRLWPVCHAGVAAHFDIAPKQYKSFTSHFKSLENHLYGKCYSIWKKLLITYYNTGCARTTCMAQMPQPAERAGQQFFWSGHLGHFCTLGYTHHYVQDTQLLGHIDRFSVAVLLLSDSVTGGNLLSPFQQRWQWL